MDFVWKLLMTCVRAIFWLFYAGRGALSSHTGPDLQIAYTIFLAVGTAVAVVGPLLAAVLSDYLVEIGSGVFALYVLVGVTLAIHLRVRYRIHLFP